MIRRSCVTCTASALALTLVGLLGTALIGCHSPPGTAPHPARSDAAAASAPDNSTSYPDAPADLVAPQRVGRYTRGKGQDFGSAQGGVAYQYGNVSTSLTVYFFARDSESRALSAAEALRRKAEQFKAVLEIERQRGRWDAYRIAFDRPDSVQLEHSYLPGHVIGFAIKRGTDVKASFYYVYAFGEEWIEVRGTVVHGDWKQTDIPVFAHQIAAMAVDRASTR